MDAKKTLTTIVIVIISLIIIFKIISSSSTAIIDSADSITDSNNCSEGTDVLGEVFIYNYSDKYCYNGTTVNHLALQYDLPLNSFFSRSGLGLMLLMIAIFIFMVVIVIQKLRAR